MSRPDVQTIATAEPSVSPARLLIHYVAKKEDGSPEDRAMCGYAWDRMDVPGGRRCAECVAEFRRQYPNRRLP